MAVFGSAGSGLFRGSATRANYDEEVRSNREREHLQRKQLDLQEDALKERARQFDTSTQRREAEFGKELGLAERKLGMSADREAYLRKIGEDERTYRRGREAKKDEWATELQSQKRQAFTHQMKMLEENAAKLQEQDGKRKMSLGAFMAWFASNADGQPGSKKNATLVKAAEPIFKEYGMPVPVDAYRTRDGKTVFVGNDGVPVEMPDDEWRGVVSEFGGLDDSKWAGGSAGNAGASRSRATETGEPASGELTAIEKEQLKALTKALENAADNTERQEIIAAMNAIDGGGGDGGGTGKYVKGKTYLITHSGRKVKALFNGVGFTLLQ